MSYTDLINQTRTTDHHIAPVVNQPTTLAEKLSSAKGTGLTGSAIKKVANFIGMDEAALAIQHTPIVPGMLSVDLELEAQARRQSMQRIAALEEAEQLRRLTLPEAEMKRKVLAIFTSRRVQNDLASPPKRNNDRNESARFLKYLRANLSVIEEAERSRRMADKTGEILRRELAKEVTYKVLVGLQSPQLRSTTHMINAPWPTEYNSALNVFGGAALDVTKHIAGRAMVSAYQVADFALRVGKFFGPKAMVKGAAYTEKAVAVSQVVGEQALETGKVLGHSALLKTQSLGHVAADKTIALGQTAAEKTISLGQTAAEKTLSLGQTALIKTQSLGNQAVSGVQAIGHLATDAVVNTALGAQHLTEQAVSGAQTLGQKATDAVVNSAVGAQHLTEQAIQSAKNLKDQTQSAVVDAAHAVQDWAITPEPVFDWSNVNLLEEEEREARNGDNVNPARLMLAMKTSALIRDLAGSSSINNPAYGTRVVEEMERFDRRSDQTNARANAHRAASIIGAYRQSLFDSSRAPVALTQAVNSAPVSSQGMASASAPSIPVAHEFSHTEASRGINQAAPMPQIPAVQMAQAPVVPQTGNPSPVSPFVSQTALDAFAKAFQQTTPPVVYRPAM